MALFPVAMWFAPNTDIKQWAHDEALVRELLEEAGEEIEMGRNYSQELFGPMWVKRTAGERPVLHRDYDPDEE